MEAVFKRDMNHNYLILPVKSSSYQVTMFCSNRIDGLLQGIAKNYNGEEMIYYDISGKQNLLRVYERRELGFEEIKRLFYSWSGTVSEAERYLLDPMHFCCSPEYIYYSYQENRTEWLFYPENEEKNEPFGIVLLAEFLLEKVDHKDRDAVDLVYQFYRSVKDGTFLLSQILEQMEAINVRAPILNDESEKEDYDLEDFLETEKLTEEEKEGRESILGKLGRLFNGLGKKKGNTEEANDYYDKPETEEIIPEEQDVATEEEYTRTRLLWSEEEERRELVCCITGERYSLQKFPFVVGKSEADVDLCLKDPSVSRLHARFFERDGKVWIEDLNSTNGILVNELRLETNETVMLARGDRIYLGDSGFIYN
ncbi:MAG: FHA domain-containing protein [Lachnospiraceae bacterium]|nr:FHA domain-containing protein [Lachnospiraceae bacterium]